MPAQALRHLVGVRVVDVLPPRLAIPLRARLGHRDREVSVLGRFVERGGVAVDVGAHKGAYTWHLARLVGRDGRVHAFEPQPRLAERLRQGLQRVDVHCVALSDRAGSAALSVPIWGETHMTGHATLEPHADHHDVLQVTTHTLDEFDTNPSLMKIDTEGHELSVLHGATKTIEASRPVLLLEVDFRHRAGRRRELLRWLAERDYVACYVDDRRALREIVLSAEDPNPLPGAGRYVFNWFFLPAESR